MKAQLTIIAVLLALIWISVPALGQDLSVCDYAAATNTNQLTSLQLSGSYHQVDDRYADDRGNVDNGDFALRGLTWRDGPQWGYRFEGSANVQYSADAVTTDYAINSSGDIRHYLTEVNDQLFAFGGVDSIGTPLQSGFSLSVLAGAGYGRFKNVSPMAKVFAIMRLFQERGVIEEPLENDALIEIAQRIDEQETSGLSAELLSEIESRLGEAVSLETVIALDALLRQNITRFCGWDASASIGYEAFTPDRPRRAILRAVANYATATGPLGQLVANASVTAPLTLREGFNLNAEVSYDRAISSMADLSVGYRFTGIGSLPEGEADLELVNTHTLNGSLAVQASRALSVLFQGQISHSTGYEEPEWRLDISFEYDFY